MSQQPPPVSNPYGPPPEGWAPQQGPRPGWKPGMPVQASGPPPGWQPARRKRQQDSQPGPFTWWDLGATLFYVVGFLTGLIGLVALLPPVNELLTGDEVQTQQGTFLINALGYGIFGTIAIVLSGAALWRSIKAFSYLWWLKLLLIPVAWFASIILNLLIIVILLGSEGETSDNQEAIEAMLQAVPLVAAVAVIGLLGPYVEEYFFRHLLIGKLSRYINVWVCGAISVIAFPLIHFIPALLGMTDDLSFVAIVPYLTMGIIITVGYIVSGRNLLYAWLLHAFNNVMSLLLSYFLVPWLGDHAEELQSTFWLATFIG